MTQTQLAAATGVSQSQLSKYLKGSRSPNFDEVEAICRALGIRGDDLWHEAEVRAVGGTAAEQAEVRAARERNRPSPRRSHTRPNSHTGTEQ